LWYEECEEIKLHHLQAKKRVNLGVSPYVVDSQEPDVLENSNSPLEVDFVIESMENDCRPYLDIRIFGEKFRTLLDSGASRTIMGKPGLQILEKYPAKINKTYNRFVETADAKKHAVQGVVTLPITLETRTRDINVLVVPTLSQPMILGIDFWDRMQLITDMHNRTWEFAPNIRLAYISEQQGITSGEHLSEKEKTELQALVEEHFCKDSRTLGRTDKVQHIIDTGNATPIKQRFYPMAPARQKLANAELDRMLELQVVEPSKSPWSSPFLLLDKPDGSHRFVVDFRKVNSVTKPDAYPLPKVTTILDRLRDAKFLSSLDVKHAYWQIPLHPDSKEKTAFPIPGRGLFHFITMPFGLHNAPATWQRFIDNVLGVDLEPFVFVYLDDIVIVTPTFSEHLRILKEVFRRLSDAKLTLNKDKCKFCRPELKYLGYVVDKNGLRVDPEKVEAITKIPVPRTAKEVRQFCGTASWYRRFISDFATRMYPLTSLLKKKNKFIWPKEAQEAFNDIKGCLVKSPILTCPNFEKPFTISCDASAVGIGAVLSQESSTGLGEAVVAYASRTLTKGEQKFSATERECLAVIWAVEKFRPYIEGTHFTIITDHYSLLWLHNLKDPQGRLARWALRLQPYNYTLIHRKGKEHVVPDMLSRLPTTEGQVHEVMERQESGESSDKWYRKMLKLVEEQSINYPTWRVDGGKLWKLVPETSSLTDNIDSWKEVVPKEGRTTILDEHHNSVTAGHLGVFKTYHRIRQRYYWPKMRQDIGKYIRRCQTCQKVKYDQTTPAGLLGQRRSVDKPWVMLSADLIGPLPRSTKGYKYLLVVSDTFTKFTLMFPLRAATATLVAKHIEEDVFMVFGVPNYFICDNGSEFIGKPTKKVLHDYKVKLVLNAKRHPQANPTERTNRTIITMLRAYISENHRHWDKDLAHLGFALRTAVQETTGHTPAFLTFGRELQASGEGYALLDDPSSIPAVGNATDHATHLKKLDEIFKTVTKKLDIAHKKSADRYNLRRRSLEFNVGDLVLKRNFVQSDAAAYFSSKLTPRFTGPYRIDKRTSSVTYVLKDMDGSNIGVWHVSDLKPYYEDLR